MVIRRDKYLDRLIQRMNNGLTKIITGIRRCGKSYLLNELFYNYLLSIGIRQDHILRFAFDSTDDLMRIDEGDVLFGNTKRKVDPKKFVSYLYSLIKDDDTYYILLDEVQLLGNFEMVINGFMRKKNLDIYVTGSNSKFLSSDIITEFAGRGDEIHVLPLSYSEFYAAYSGKKEEALDEYLTYGGLPAVSSTMHTKEQKMTYLQTQTTNVYLRDIIQRYNLKNADGLNDLLNLLSSGLACLVNPSKLENTFKSEKRITLTAPTIDRYIDYFEDSFLTKRAYRYDIKGKKYINSPYKIYFEDLGLRNAQLNFRQTEASHLMENAIYNELRYRGFNVDVGIVETREKDNAKDVRKQREVDFVANKGNARYYIQSALSISSEEKWEQETLGFDKINDSFKKILIVRSNILPKINEKGYVVINIEQFLLDENSLDL